MSNGRRIVRRLCRNLLSLASGAGIVGWAARRLLASATKWNAASIDRDTDKMRKFKWVVRIWNLSNMWV